MAKSPPNSSYPRKLLTLCQHYQKERVIVVRNLPLLYSLFSRLFTTKFNSYWRSRYFRAVFQSYLVFLWTLSPLPLTCTTLSRFISLTAIIKPPLFQLPKPFLAVAEDDSRYAELDSSTLQQCSGNNRIGLSSKGFSTTTDDTLLCLNSLMFNYAIPALLNCPAISVPLPDAPQTFYLAEGLYHVISREPLLHPKKCQWFICCQCFNHSLSSLHFEAQLSQYFNPESRRRNPWTGHGQMLDQSRALLRDNPTSVFPSESFPACPSFFSCLPRLFVGRSPPFSPQ